MEEVFFDWGRGRVHTLRNNDPDDSVVKYKSIDELFDTFTGPTYVVSEATFESYEPAKRLAILERARQEGYTWLTTPTRQTARHRAKMGLEKSDEVDVAVIRDLARTKPGCLKVPGIVFPNDPRALGSKRVAHEMVLLRNTYTGNGKENERDVLSNSITVHLPPVRSLTPVQRKIFEATPGGLHWSKVLVGAVTVAARNSKNRRDFDHYTGLHAHGYPSQIRSDIMMHRWKSAQKKGVTLSEFRREIRWLRHRINEVVDKLGPVD